MGANVHQCTSKPIDVRRLAFDALVLGGFSACDFEAWKARRNLEAARSRWVGGLERLALEMEQLDRLALAMGIVIPVQVSLREWWEHERSLRKVRPC